MLFSLSLSASDSQKRPPTLLQFCPRLAPHSLHLWRRKDGLVNELQDCESGDVASVPSFASDFLPWACPFTSLGLCFSICEMGRTTHTAVIRVKQRYLCQLNWVGKAFGSRELCRHLSANGTPHVGTALTSINPAKSVPHAACYSTPGMESQLRMRVVLESKPKLL